PAGYTQQLTFRKPDGSYAAFIGRPSSTWLTAYVAKVFFMAINLIDIEPEVICGAVKWLILEKQKPDGIFKEDAPVIHSEMLVWSQPALALGRSWGGEMGKGSLDTAIERAAEYLSRRYQSLARPYTVALASYALALAGKLPTEKVLMKHSK
ncbi:CO3 protein, partial [Semnornis frantzii]|nr:CO3 protein [Semnornis frantzii]